MGKRGPYDKRKLTEEEKFLAFEQQKAKRYVKHMTSLHPECKGCNINRRWVDADYENLVLGLQFKVTLADLSLKLDRPVNGISAKLSQLGLVYVPRTIPFKLLGTEIVKRGYVNRMPELARKALLEQGWKPLANGSLLAPMWWRDKQIHRGTTMEKDL